VLAPTNDMVGRLNRRMQQHRLDAGELHGTGRQLPTSELDFVGDEVATRHNDRSLRTDKGEMIRNRARWTVEALAPDGGITVAGRDGRVTLPADYVAKHLELAYAGRSTPPKAAPSTTACLWLTAAPLTATACTSA